MKTFRTTYLPYCLQRQPDGSYAVLNRDYKPVGFITDAWVEYSGFPVLCRIRKLRPRVAAQLSIHGAENLDRIYLYDDGSVPTLSADHMQNYLARLARLAELEVEPV
jgi:hypothetical protein